MTEKNREASALHRIWPCFEEAYARYNRREFISPDPLETIYPYSRTEDREVAALLVSSIAYGRVAMILRSARRLLELLGPSPTEFLKTVSPLVLARETELFRHRFTSGAEIAALMTGIGRILREYGSVEEFLAVSLSRTGDVLEGISNFVENVRRKSSLESRFLLPSPSDGSACKRFFLFLKWMVRRDEVDPGGWTALKPRDLLIPMDVHMFRICSTLGMTRRKQPDLKTAIEVTALFREILPEDPTKFDFVLTRFGIRKELSETSFLEKCQGALHYASAGHSGSSISSQKLQ